jgi:hypothetical protein
VEVAGGVLVDDEQAARQRADYARRLGGGVERTLCAVSA